MGAGQQTTPRDGGPLLTPASARFSFILFDCFLKPQRDTQLLVKRSDLTPERVQHGAGLPAGRHLDPHSPASRGGGCSPPLPEPSRRSPEAPIGRVGCGPGAQGPAGRSSPGRESCAGAGPAETSPGAAPSLPKAGPDLRSWRTRGDGRGIDPQCLGRDLYAPRASAGPRRSSGPSPWAPPAPSGAETPRRRPPSEDAGTDLPGRSHLIHPPASARPVSFGNPPPAMTSRGARASRPRPPGAKRFPRRSRPSAHAPCLRPRNLGLYRRRHHPCITTAPGRRKGVPRARTRGRAAGGPQPFRPPYRGRDARDDRAPPPTSPAPATLRPHPPAPRPLPRPKPGRRFRRRPLPGTAAPRFPPAGRALPRPAAAPALRGRTQGWRITLPLSGRLVGGARHRRVGPGGRRGGELGEGCPCPRPLRRRVSRRAELPRGSSAPSRPSPEQGH